MDESILNTIKKMLGIDESCVDFDSDILVRINSAIDVLRQIIKTVSSDFLVYDDTQDWSELLEDDANLSTVKNYIFLRVKTGFDPYTNPTLKDVAQHLLEEIEWRLSL